MVTKTKFQTLDGLRGVAAICIVLLHGHRYFFDHLPSAQMAVDLFFVLSGFVLAHNYAPRFREGMCARTFMLLRFARLYPLYLLGIMLGLVEALLSIHYQRGIADWTWSELGTALPFNLFMLPTPIGGTMFPLNGIMWTIFLELVVNLVWVLSFRVLEELRVLVAVIAVSGATFAIVSLWLDTTALGLGWNTFLGGFARVMYSFMLGLLVYRIRGSIRIPRVPPILLLVVLPALAALHLNTVEQLACALVVFPVVVLVGASAEPVGLVRVICEYLGAASYAVYALHKRLYLLSYAFLLQVLGIEAEDLAPWAGIAFLAALLGGSIFLARVVEPPARRLLTRLLVPKTEPRARGETLAG